MQAVISPSILSGTVTAPPSKSAGHRSIICAALSNGPVSIFNCGESDDIAATASAVHSLGATVERNGLTVRVTPAKKNHKNITINCNESGSTARFMIPVAAALGVEKATFTGRGRLPERPFKVIADALRKNGVFCSSDNLPMTVSGRLKSGVFEIPGDISSQYISGLLLALSITEGESEIRLTSPLESKSYVMMTVNELRSFGADISLSENTFFVKGQNSLKACDRTVEGDWSQAAFFLCSGAISGDITVNGITLDTLQGDSAVIDILKQFGADVTKTDNGFRVKGSKLHGITINAAHIPDLVPILAVTAAFADGQTAITNASRLRFKESDRIKETVEGLKAFGIDAFETDDGIIINGSLAKSSTISSANDHRKVMAFSVMAAHCSGISMIDGAEAINKSYPDFFNDFISLGGKAECHQR